MSSINILKNKLAEKNPAYSLFQKISLPIYSFNIKHEIDSDIIKEKCLSLKTNINHKPDLVKSAWQSPYYHTEPTGPVNDLSKQQFENFSKLIEIVENKINKIHNNYCVFEVYTFWVVIYNSKGSLQEWHSHIKEAGPFSVDNIHNFSGVYYPEVDDESSPIEFKNEDSDNLKIKVQQGQLLIFPASAEHRVPESSTAKLRIAVAFNFRIKKMI